MGLKESLPIFLVLFALMASSALSREPTRREFAAEKHLERCLLRCDEEDGQCMARCVDQFDRQTAGSREAVGSGGASGGRSLENKSLVQFCIEVCNREASDAEELRFCKRRCHEVFSGSVPHM